jgi:GNAT superfamily N-acetyltransferase
MNVRSATPKDLDAVKNILDSTPEFNEKDTACCVECLDEFLSGGLTYRFICAEEDGRISGFACYGRDFLADDVLEVYWIVVAPKNRKKGVGRIILSHIEEQAAREGVRMITAETESDPTYAGTRRFYERCDYRLEACIKDFYGEGDDKIIYGKRIGAAEKKDDWGSLLPAGIERPEDIPKKFGFHDEIGEVVKKFPMRVSRHYMNLIERPGDPIWRQCIPDRLELEDFGVEDPLNATPTGCCFSSQTSARLTAGFARGRGESATRRRL